MVIPKSQPETAVQANQNSHQHPRRHFTTALIAAGLLTSTIGSSAFAQSKEIKIGIH